VTTFSDNSSVDHQIENVYEQAAGLFDPNTTLDIDKDEYARGVVELVMNLLGMDSDDKEDIASIISERTLTPRARLDRVINRHFPNRLLTFYNEDPNFEVAAIEDHNGDMWRVWADGDTQRYPNTH
jgi:hypothetical protein